MRGWKLALAAAMGAVALGGCVRTAIDVVTLPVRAAGYTVDKLTTSRDEADRNLGRQVRRDRAEEREAAARELKARRKAQKEAGREARRRDDD